jgi:hypothetical protein
MNREHHPQNDNFFRFSDGIRLEDVVGNGHDQAVRFFSERQLSDVVGSKVAVSNVAQPPTNLGKTVKGSDKSIHAGDYRQSGLKPSVFK